ncbi:helix-turn-helix transcriptional regulator [Pseudomonas sp. UL073]|uniref:Helix-turn-helix transcriptional regulator n=1 Tax=Zestomonas insulae TaxID=2809017 RepID=A0ABS2IAV9_9GAMM|nr:helix-turn-helix transcriptional regulator [Pseudomonas insulae]MBM7060145.1 helix-turn-helix transcriptional regulator [Pseudomonas insulae]
MLIEYPLHGRLAAIAVDYRDGQHVAVHRHQQAQFLYAASGLMRLVTAQGAWIIPPTRAVWIPPEVEHEIFMSGAVRMRTLFIPETADAGGFSACQVLAVTALLRELILRAIQLQHADDHASYPLVQELILREIAALERLPLHLPMPVDRRLQAICLRLLQQPQHPHTLEDWSQEVGASSRTLARLFRQELQMSFQEWRQQLRLTEALPRLLAGDSVQGVARDLGYGSARAFSAMFRRLLGENPREYVQALGRLSALKG